METNSVMKKDIFDTNISVLVNAKEEYTKQLIQLLKPQLLSGLISIFNESKNVCSLKDEKEFTLCRFQEMLSKIPEWNQAIIDEETTRIINEVQCDWMEDLLTAIFVSHTKILTTIRTTSKNKKINLIIPRIDSFIHKVYIEVAREFWKSPYLVDDRSISKLQYQKNLRECEGIIAICIEETIRKLLPVKEILREYLTNDAEECEEKESMQGGGENGVVFEQPQIIDMAQLPETSPVMNSSVENIIDSFSSQPQNSDIIIPTQTENQNVMPVTITEIPNTGGNVDFVSDISITNPTTDVSLTSLSSADQHVINLAQPTFQTPSQPIIQQIAQPTITELPVFTPNQSTGISDINLNNLISNDVAPSSMPSTNIDIGFDALPTVNVDFGGGSQYSGISGVQVQNDVIKEIENFHKANATPELSQNSTQQISTPTNSSYSFF